jgi:hypothetical protein
MKLPQAGNGIRHIGISFGNQTHTYFIHTSTNNEKDKLKVIIGYISNVIHNYNNIVAYHLKCLEFYYNTIKDLDYTIGTTVEKINNLEKENN